MKIAQISTCYRRTPPLDGYGGTEWVASYLTEQLVARGHDVTLFATGDSETQAKLWSFYDLPIRMMDHLNDEVIHVGKAYEYLRDANFDVVHNHSAFMGPVILSLSETPNFTTVHSSIDDKYKFLYRDICKYHRYVSISERQRQLNPELNWIGTVHNAINIADYPFKADKGDYLLFVGLIAPWKGPHLAVQAAIASGRRLKIAGPIHETERSYFRQQILPHVDGRVIEYLGEVAIAQKTELYQNAAALLVPSCWEEPFGLVIIEALACGTPVVAFSTGAIPELVVDRKVGFLVDGVINMSKAIRNIGSISPLACRKHVVESFNAERMTDQYVHIYEQIIST